MGRVRLDEFLLEWLSRALPPPVTKKTIRKLIVAGAVYVNRSRARSGTVSLYPGAIVEIFYDAKGGKADAAASKRHATELAAAMRSSWIVYEDDDLIAINKPPGIPSQPTVDPNRPNAFDLCRNFLKQRANVTHQVYLGQHHRLDRDTSGVLIFTKRETANEGIARAFQERTAKKSYQAIAANLGVTREVNDVFQVQGFMGRVSAKSEIAKMGMVKSGGDFSETEFRVIETFRRGVLWLRASPKTGRTHQIRVHLASLNMPILADPLYFPSDTLAMAKAPRLMLHAASLEITHPKSGKTILLEAPLPADFLAVLESLQ
jgi:RluA family pseudouridine synthase